MKTLFGCAFSIPFVLVLLPANSTAQTTEERTVDANDRQRQAIFLAAKDLFLNHGYGATSMADIAKASGVDARTLKTHYASKETLEVEMLNWSHEVELDHFRKWIADFPLSTEWITYPFRPSSRSR